MLYISALQYIILLMKVTYHCLTSHSGGLDDSLEVGTTSLPDDGGSLDEVLRWCAGGGGGGGAWGVRSGGGSVAGGWDVVSGLGGMGDELTGSLLLTGVLNGSRYPAGERSLVDPFSTGDGPGLGGVGVDGDSSGLLRLASGPSPPQATLLLLSWPVSVSLGDSSGTARPLILNPSAALMSPDKLFCNTFTSPTYI